MTDRTYQPPADGTSANRRFFKLFTDIAARADIPSSAKVLLAIIVDHIGNNSRSWPGTRLLSRESGLDRTTVIACVARLDEAGLLSVERTGNGKRNYYCLPGRETQPVEQSNRSEHPTGTGRKAQPEPVGKSGHNQTDQVKEETTPLPPLQKGGGSGSALPVADKDGAAGIEGRIAAAYEAVYGGRPNARKLKTLIATAPDKRLAQLCNGELLARAERWRAKNRPHLSPGLGTLCLALDVIAAACAQSARTPDAPSAPAARERETAQDAQRQAESAARREHFATLPPAEQERYRQRAREGKFAPKRADVLDATAAAFAWQDRTSVGEPTKG